TCLCSSPTSRAHLHTHSFPTRRSSDLGYPYYPLGRGGKPDFNNRIKTLDEMYQDSKRLAVQGAYDTKNYELLRQTWNMVIYTHKDRKSTRLNSSHVKISYAVFCLKKNR